MESEVGDLSMFCSSEFEINQKQSYGIFEQNQNFMEVQEEDDEALSDGRAKGRAEADSI